MLEVGKKYQFDSFQFTVEQIRDDVVICRYDVHIDQNEIGTLDTFHITSTMSIYSKEI